VVLHMGYTWQIALGAVFLSAVIFFALSIFKIREWIIASIPLPLRAGIAAGIGLFLALIALEGAGIVVDNPATLVGLGDLTKPGPLLALLGFFIIVVLEARRVTGAVLIGILVVRGRVLCAAVDCADLYAAGYRRRVQRWPGERDLCVPVCRRV